VAKGARTGVRNWLARLSPRDRGEAALLAGALALVLLTIAFFVLAGQVLEGDTQRFDERVLRALRRPDDPATPIGPQWLRTGALDITSLGSPTVLGLAVLSMTGFFLLQGMYRTAGFVFVASVGGWFLNGVLKEIFQRARPVIVPHLRDVVSSSFPSGHAMTSAAVYLTLGALSMRVAHRPITKFYCMAVAMFLTLLVGASRVFMGVHYPTDVLAGWLIGLTWALACWLTERALERRTGLKKEQQKTVSGP
jgi:undecaprenyl-diphosphatase